MTKIKSLCAVILLCCAVSYGRANTILTDPGPGIKANSGRNNTLGFHFTVGSAPLLVTALGLWDESLNGFTNSHTVGLWDNSGNLLSSILIPSGIAATLSGEFRYVNLATPVTLLVGTTYVLGGSYLQFDADRIIVNFSQNHAAFDPAVTSGSARAVENAGFAFPKDNHGPGTFVGPSAQFTLLATNGVPELGPGMLVLALVFGGLIFLHRRTALAV